MDPELRKIEKLFKPQSIAVVGASRNPKKVGGTILKNILANGFNGKIYAVNPKATEIMGVPSYPRLVDIPDQIDHVVISVPADKVAEVLEEAGKVGAKVATVITSGFKEAGRADLEEKIVETARKNGIRILGPNMFGVVYTPAKLNATFGPENVYPGKIAFMTQSGALGIALMAWTATEEIGLSSIVSMGNMADLDVIDVAKFFAEDENTRVITMYLEGISIGRGKSFIEEFRKIVHKKPVIALKAGRSSRGTKAIASHTGSLAGSDALYDAAFKQSGILRAYDIEQLFDWAKIMASLPEPVIRGKGFVIITNGGGIGVMATDASVFNNLPLLEISDELKKKFKEEMPWYGSAANPIDLTGGANAENYAGALRIAMEHPDVSGVVVMYCEVGFLDPLQLAEELTSVVSEYEETKKPVVGVMLGGERAKEAAKKMDKSGIPTYPTPERAVSAMSALYKYAKFTGKTTL